MAKPTRIFPDDLPPEDPVHVNKLWEDDPEPVETAEQAVARQLKEKLEKNPPTPGSLSKGTTEQPIAAALDHALDMADKGSQTWLIGQADAGEILARYLSQGFTLHPLDGNRSNDDTLNLVLIWKKDVDKLDAFLASQEPQGDLGMEKYTEYRINKSRACYELRRAGKSWSDISTLCHTQYGNSITLAKNYAEKNNLPWPIAL